jgi:hypothetical protein
MRKILFTLLACFLVVATGCIWHSGVNAPYFQVENSGLNWVEIRQYETVGMKRRIKLRIDGNGMVSLREGTSALVGNQFAANHKQQNWEDIREKRLKLSEDDTTLIFQSLVDTGLFEKYEGVPFLNDKPVASTNDTSFVYVSANINNKTAGSADPVGKPELLEQLKITILTFYQPQPMRQKRDPSF